MSCRTTHASIRKSLAVFGIVLASFG
ncbi:MAG: hypothetical protein QOH90_750, partial [Actinomycetota bacterium]|nr:hypothetical protein [Actinomycetota bacterium]